jgi:DtxR family Mn-dependent transcriptional regulator
MRLTEEIVELLTALGERERQDSPGHGLTLSEQIENPAELIAECEHEGYVESADHGSGIRLTDYGRAALRRISQQLSSANQLRVGEQARIAYLSTRNYPRFQKLSSLGLSPGVPVRVQQKFPSFVIQCEETQIALEEEIARDIFVWRD